MDMYWSESTMLQKIPEATVAETSCTALFRREMMRAVTASIMPDASITPPKTITQSISHIVPSMPYMPEVQAKVSSIGSPVDTVTSAAKDW